MNKIYATGDTHGTFKRIETFCKDYNTTCNDVLIILGDVGFNYFNGPIEKEKKEYCSKLPITLFCIQGNHEERPYNISSYQTKIWNDGIVYFEPEFPNLIFAKDGEIYTFNDKKVLVIGGAYSVDKWIRILSAYLEYGFLFKKISDSDLQNALHFIKGDDEYDKIKAKKTLNTIYKNLPKGTCFWFPDEQPNKEIKNYVKSQIMSNEIDIVLSHTCPSKFIPTDCFLSSINQDTVDNSTEKWLNTIEKSINYEKWLCGHWHTNKTIGKTTFLFEEFIEL